VRACSVNGFTVSFSGVLRAPTCRLTIARTQILPRLGPSPRARERMSTYNFAVEVGPCCSCFGVTYLANSDYHRVGRNDGGPQQRFQVEHRARPHPPPCCPASRMPFQYHGATRLVPDKDAQEPRHRFVPGSCTCDAQRVAPRAAAWAPRSCSCAPPRRSAWATRLSTCAPPKASALAPRSSTCDAQRAAPWVTACAPRPITCAAPPASAWASRPSTCDKQRAPSRTEALAPRSSTS
jgi:hypothetical protein